jgi:hypothetical protein
MASETSALFVPEVGEAESSHKLLVSAAGIAPAPAWWTCMQCWTTFDRLQPDSDHLTDTPSFPCACVGHSPGVTVMSTASTTVAGARRTAIIALAKTLDPIQGQTLATEHFAWMEKMGRWNT